MKILMLGNGFDLYHKLPTTYLCFLQTVKLLSEITEVPENIACVFEELKGKCKNIDNSYNAYRDFYKKYSFDRLDEERIKHLQLLSNKNIWFNYLWNTYNKDIGWIDFEKEIAKVIKCFETADLEEFRKNIKEMGIETETILNMFDFFYDRVSASSQANSGIVIIQPAHLKIHGEFLTEEPYGSNNYIVDIDKISQKLYDELLDLAILLKEYLETFVNRPLFKMKEAGIIETNPAFSDCNETVSFNYTDTYKVLYDNEKEINQIHGNLKDNIVLGINPDKNDEKDNLNTSFILFKKYYQRVLYKTDLTYIRLIKDLHIERTVCEEYKYKIPNELVVVGHSLDESDRDIIEELFDLSNTIKVYYHDENALSEYIKKLVSIFGKKAFDDLRLNHNLSFIKYGEQVTE